MSGDVKHRPIKPYADANDWVVVQSDDAGLGEEKRVKGGLIAHYPTVADLPPASEFNGVAQAGYKQALSNGIMYLSDDKTKLNKGVKKWFGIGSTGATTTFNRTSGFKVEAEASFTSVQFLIANATTADVGITGICAVTETAALDTVDNSTKPVSGGVVKNALDAADEIGGWRTITKNGSGTLTNVAGVSRFDPGFLLTDDIPLKSIDRADGGVRPLLMTRFYIDGGVTPWSFAVGDADSNVETAANRGRIIQTVSSATGVNAVSDPTLDVAVTNVVMPLVIPIFTHASPTITVAAIGDSLTENNGLLGGTGPETSANWLYRACAAISTPELPVYPVNLGCSGENQSVYFASALKYLAAAKVTVAFFAAFSPNDSAGSIVDRYNDMLSRTYTFISYCRDNAIVPILVTGAPNDAYTLAVDNLRKAHNVAIRAAAAALNIAVLDFDALLTDGASPANYIPAYKFDDTHFNELAIETVLAPAAKRCIEIAI